MSFAELGQVLIKDALAIEQTFEECAKIAIDPNLTFEQKELQISEKLSNRGESSSNTYNKESEKQAKEAATKHLVKDGWSPEAIEKWFQTHWQQFTDPENLRNLKKKVEQAPANVEKAAKWGWGKWLAFCVALGVGIHIVAPSEQQQPVVDVPRIVHDADERSRALQEIKMTTDQFQLMVGGMLVPVAPNPALPAAPLPAAVEAVADIPVAVEVTTEQGTRDYAVPVGQIYRAATPEGRQRIEQEAPKIEHDYDKPSRNDCYANDCLNQHRDEWNRHINELNERRNQKDYDVTMGDGSSKIEIRH